VWNGSTKLNHTLSLEFEVYRVTVNYVNRFIRILFKDAMGNLAYTAFNGKVVSK
jgi:hypothetical protein